MANDLSFQANIAIFESVGFFFAQVRDHVIKYFPFECLHDWRLPVALTHNRLLSLSRPFLFLLLAPLYWVCVCVCAVYCVLICFCSIDKLRISIVVFCNCASRNGILLELKRDPFRYNNCTFVNFRLFTNWRIEFDPIRLRSEGCSTHFKRERNKKKMMNFERQISLVESIFISVCQLYHAVRFDRIESYCIQFLKVQSFGSQSKISFVSVSGIRFANVRIFNCAEFN